MSWGKADMAIALRNVAFDPKRTKAPRFPLVCVLTIVSEAVTVMVGRVEFSAATHADENA